jgi:exopolyphosphatase/guanosine-5'-triphosphate,3'-diphosphate pyrophosphatase
MSMNAASIDLGTNSIKILIVRRDSDGHMHVLFRHRSVVRLGEGTFTAVNKGKIPRFVQVRTLKVLQTYANLLHAYNVDVVRATGTSALRDAKNGPQFVADVRAKTGLALEILPADEEARLIVKGVSSDLTVPRKPVLFIDIGGGSCEITLVNKKKIEKFVSLPLGAVRLTEIFLPQQKFDAAKTRKLDLHIKKVLKDQWPNPAAVKLAFGSAGTIRALARLISKTELTEDERSITRKQLERASINISKMSKRRIAALPGIDNKRAEILKAGTQTLNAIFEYFKIDELRVSSRGLREGMLIDLFDHPQKPSGFSVDKADEERLNFYNKIASHYHSNRPHCLQVWNLARQLFDELAPVHGLADIWKPILMASALLHDVGRFINSVSSHKHSFYILNNTDFPFFSERERLMLATLARYHRKSPPKPDHEGYSQLNEEDKKILEKLASILRLADGLDAPHDQGVKWLKCQWGPGKIHINAELKNGSLFNQEVLADKVKLFESLFKVTISVSQIQGRLAGKPLMKESSRGA